MRLTTKLVTLAAALVAGLLMAPAPGFAPTAVEYAVAPTGLFPGQTARVALLLAVQKVREPVMVRLVLVGVETGFIGSAEYFVEPGQGLVVDMLMGDGSVRVGKQEFTVPLDATGRFELLPFLFVGSRSGGARALASLQVFGPEAPHTQVVLPYIEQQNLR